MTFVYLFSICHKIHTIEVSVYGFKLNVVKVKQNGNVFSRGTMILHVSYVFTKGGQSVGRVYPMIMCVLKSVISAHVFWGKAYF